MRKVGDFGIALFQHKDDERTPGAIHMMHTPNEVPDKQDLEMPENDEHLKPMSEETNGRGIGKILWRLLTTDLDLKEDDLDDQDPEKRKPQLDEWTSQNYRRAIIPLVISCLKFDSDQRPTFGEIMKFVKRKMNDT
jgi:hypothetical protein